MITPPSTRISVSAVTLRDICLDSNDGLDLVTLRFCIEIDGTEHIAMIGQSKSGHVERRSLRQDIIDSIGTIQKTELTVQMKVSEI
jgi:hypothetical protein